jgi:hypothetical protein
MDKVFYNKSSADSLDWEPSWFGVLYHDEKLVKAIRKWQKDNGLAADGLCGPSTYRRIWTERDANISSYINRCPPKKDQSFIICNSELVKIDWPSVVLWDDPEGFKSKSGSYYDYAGKKDRAPTMFVNHWDVCLSSESCAKVLNKRGISVHFLIDNDGTIYQMLDTQHGAWHAGVGKINHKSIGVEISNAYYTKYQSWYEKNGFGPRPVVSNAWVNGNKLKEHLDFYPVQIKAAQALWYACSSAYDIPLESIGSGDDNFKTSSKTETSVSSGKFKGIVSHYHITKRKIDCAGLDIISLLEEGK